MTTKLVDRLLEARGVKNLETSREMLESLVEAREPVSYSTFVTGVFDLYGKGQGKRLVGDKTPAYVRRIPTLHALWPEARFVHIIRDGRDVCMSAINWRKADHALGRFSTWGVDPITTAAVWWEWHVRLGREDGGSLAPKLYHEVRYEALVSEPAKDMRETLRLPRSSLRRRHAQIPRGPREGGPQPRREEGVAAPHSWTAEVERTDARRGPRALRGGCRRSPRGARLPSSLPAPARGEAGSGSTDP